MQKLVDNTITDFRALLSTKKMLREIGGDIYYDGPVFVFRQKTHPNPRKEAIRACALEYMRGIIIPNALLAKKYNRTVPIELAKQAISHIMLSKTERVGNDWKELCSDPDFCKDILDRFAFYVMNFSRDGKQLPEEKRCYFDKYVSVNTDPSKKGLPIATSKIKSKTVDRVNELLERMKTDEGKWMETASRRKLIESGITGTVARKFMKARVKVG